MVFNSARDTIRAMTAGDIAFAHSGCIAAVSGLANGLDAELIWIHNLLNVSDAIAARNGAGIDSLVDLKGRRVAATFTSTAHYALERGLASVGLKPSDVEMIDMQPQEIFAAWSRGDFDAAAAWDPTLSSLENSKIIYTAGDSAADGYPIFDFGLVRREFAEEYPDLVVDYIQALEKAEQLMRSDSADAITTLADDLDQSVEDTTTQANGSIWLTGEEQLAEEYLGGDTMADNLYQMAQYLYDGGNLAEMPDKEIFENAVNASYIEKALGK